MTTTHPSELKVVTGSETIKLFTSNRFKLFRHAFPLIAILGSYWLLSFPSLSFVELLVLVLVTAGICTSTIRYGTLALLKRRSPEQTGKTLLELKDGMLQLALDDIDETISLKECDHISVWRNRWWIAPHLAFTIKCRNGYRRTVETNIDLPELRRALMTISDNVLPAFKDTSGSLD